MQTGDDLGNDRPSLRHEFVSVLVDKHVRYTGLIGSESVGWIPGAYSCLERGGILCTLYVIVIVIVYWSLACVCFVWAEQAYWCFSICIFCDIQAESGMNEWHDGQTASRHV